MIKSNLSRTYLLPLISPVIGIEQKFYNLIENTYLFDSNKEYNNCFFIVQDFSFKNPEYTAYEHRITNNDLFVKCIDIGSKVIYIYNFPKEYTHEYNEFINSRYSTFLDDAKKQILKYWTILKGGTITSIGFVTKVKQILYKEQILKNELEKQLNVTIPDEAELGNYVDLDMETINLDNFKNKQDTVLKKEK